MFNIAIPWNLLLLKLSLLAESVLEHFRTCTKQPKQAAGMPSMNTCSFEQSHVRSNKLADNVLRVIMHSIPTQRVLASLDLPSSCVHSCDDCASLRHRERMDVLEIAQLGFRAQLFLLLRWRFWSRDLSRGFEHRRRYRLLFGGFLHLLIHDGQFGECKVGRCGGCSRGSEEVRFVKGSQGLCVGQAAGGVKGSPDSTKRPR